MVSGYSLDATTIDRAELLSGLSHIDPRFPTPVFLVSMLYVLFVGVYLFLTYRWLSDAFPRSTLIFISRSWTGEAFPLWRLLIIPTLLVVPVALGGVLLSMELSLGWLSTLLLIPYALAALSFLHVIPLSMTFMFQVMLSYGVAVGVYFVRWVIAELPSGTALPVALAGALSGALLYALVQLMTAFVMSPISRDAFAMGGSHRTWVVMQGILLGLSTFYVLAMVGYWAILPGALKFGR